MRDRSERGGFEAGVRRTFDDLVRSALPAAARSRGWAVTTPAAFERIVLDHVFDAPWETALDVPCASRVCLLDLVLAVETAGRLITGEACIEALHRRSRAIRAAHREKSCDAAVANLIRRARTATGGGRGARGARSPFP